MLWVFNVYIVFYVVMLILVGGLVDMYGCKKVFMVGVMFFFVVLVVCGLVGSVGWLIVVCVL